MLRHHSRKFSAFAIIAVFAVLSFLIIAIATMTRTTETSGSARAAEYLGPCEQFPPVNAPAGYRWRADCSASCNPDDVNSCPKSTDPYVYADTSAWCYGFNTYTQHRCMMLEHTGGGSGGVGDAAQPPSGGGSGASCTPGALKGSYCDDFTEKPRRFKVDVFYNDDCSDRYEAYDRQRACDGESGGSTNPPPDKNPPPTDNPPRADNPPDNPTPIITPPNDVGNNGSTEASSPPPITGSPNRQEGMGCAQIFVNVNRDGAPVSGVNVTVKQGGNTQANRTQGGQLTITPLSQWAEGLFTITVESQPESETFTRDIRRPTCSTAVTLISSRNASEADDTRVENENPAEQQPRAVTPTGNSTCDANSNGGFGIPESKRPEYNDSEFTCTRHSSQNCYKCEFKCTRENICPAPNESVLLYKNGAGMYYRVANCSGTDWALGRQEAIKKYCTSTRRPITFRVDITERNILLDSSNVYNVTLCEYPRGSIGAKCTIAATGTCSIGNGTSCSTNLVKAYSADELLKLDFRVWLTNPETNIEVVLEPYFTIYEILPFDTFVFSVHTYRTKTR